MMVSIVKISRAIAPLIELLEIPVAQKFPHLLPDGQRAECRADVIAWCAAEAGLSTRQIQRIYARFRLGGVGALAKKSRSDKGTSRFFAQHVKAGSFTAYLRLSRKLNVASIHRAIFTDQTIMGIESRAMVSRETVRTFLKITPMPVLIHLALQGQATYRELASNYAKRGIFGAKGTSQL